MGQTGGKVLTGKRVTYASRLYPIIVAEYASNFASMSGSGYILSAPIDANATQATMTGNGELRSIYNSSYICFESITANNATILGSGELRSTYQFFNVGFDSMTVNSATMSGSGEMKAVYITYKNSTDAVILNNATITGTGTLQ